MFHKLTLVFTFIILSNSTTQAQDVSGKIIDEETKAPIPYVTIKYGANNGAISNEEGDFNIIFPENNSVKDSIHFSSIGYASKI